MQAIPQFPFLLEQHYALGPEELPVLQRAFERACESLGIGFGSPEKLHVLANAIVEVYEPNTDEASLISEAFALIGASVLKLRA